jgi:hypothetical protein
MWIGTYGGGLARLHRGELEEGLGPGFVWASAAA